MTVGLWITCMHKSSYSPSNERSPYEQLSYFGNMHLYLATWIHFHTVVMCR